MTKSIGSNIKVVIKESINIPTTLLAVGAEVAADLTTVTAAAIRGVVPTTKQAGKISGHFLLGAVKYDTPEAELMQELSTMSLATVLASAEQGSVRAGQSVGRASVGFFADEPTESTQRLNKLDAETEAYAQ
mgnify:CR=1 FL=1